VVYSQKMKIRPLAILVSLLPFVLVFVASLYRPSDADLGWHLKYGEYAVKNLSLLRENTFSTEMPDFIWPNISWGIDVINYLIFSAGGFLALTIAGALVITTTFYFLSKAFRLTYFEKAMIFPLLLLLQHPLNQVSFRGSLLSLFFLSILLYLLFSHEEKPSKRIWLIVPLFLLWANTHGLFILGLGILLLWIIANAIKEGFTNGFAKQVIFKPIKQYVPLFLATIAVTLIHPFGFAIYEDALLHFNNPYLVNIAEYLPFDELSHLWWIHIAVASTVAIGMFLLYLHDGFAKHLSITFLTIPLLSLAYFVRRYAWPSYYLTIPFLKPVVNFFKPDRQKTTQVSAVFILLVALSIAIFIKQPFSQFSSMNWDTYCKQVVQCSPKAVEYLKEHKLNKNLLTFYDWGGYLIWQHPDLKPSIDGRMHLWQDKKGNNAFAQYYAYEQDEANIDESKYDTVLMARKKPLYKQLNRLVKEGKWTKVFEDKTAGVFVRKK